MLQIHFGPPIRNGEENGRKMDFGLTREMGKSGRKTARNTIFEPFSAFPSPPLLGEAKFHFPGHFVTHFGLEARNGSANAHFGWDGVRDKRDPSFGQIEIRDTSRFLFNCSESVTSPFCPICPWDGWGSKGRQQMFMCFVTFGLIDCFRSLASPDSH